MKTSIVLLVGSLFFGFVSSPALALDSEAKIYEIGSNRKKLLFELRHKETTAAGKITKIHREFASPDGKPAVIEDIEMSSPEKFSKYSIKQLQTNEQGSLEIKDGKANFSYTKEGETETEVEDDKPNLVIGPTVVPYLQKNWATIMKGDDVNVRFAALDRKETVGFKFFKISENPERVVVKMKPTSIVIAAIVDPLIFTFNRDGSKLLELIGRTSPKRQKDGKWEDLDGELVFTYKN